MERWTVIMKRKGKVERRDGGQTHKVAGRSAKLGITKKLVSNEK